MTNLETANNNVRETYSQLNEIVRSITDNKTKQLDDLVKQLSSGIDKYTNSQLRELMALISIETYNISLVKEQSSLKEACAIALYKEGMAKTYSLAEGNIETKKNVAVTDNMDKQAVSILYSSVTSILKTKCDEAHRVVAALNSILISRAAEAKQYYNPRNEEDNIEFGE